MKLRFVVNNHAILYYFIDNIRMPTDLSRAVFKKEDFI